MIERPTELAHELIRREENAKIAVDMTAGNGFDSKFILDEINPEKLYAFDIQEEARDANLSLIGDRENFKFILDSHAKIDKYIKDKLDLVVYNLGYLPKGDKKITTRADSTLESLEKTLKLLNKDGKVIMTIYPGHEEGLRESKRLETFLESLSYKEYTVLRMDYINKVNNPPYCVIIGKR
ncbi:class I SAM-dependent methyltransferase [uncultured Anaerococcus sp.]|uniref:tRNA (mnm(5)s(2)U34)-methyltransferase n=1 Tax=uncultured Anaerococcus sp. TaxID=293428 RepID=UPI00261A77DA|nr:class I SAM-dependent methyltransferase [uncultured Anaerococcus sp.]